MGRKPKTKLKSYAEGVIDRQRGVIGLRCTESKKFSVLIENLIPEDKWKLEEGIYFVDIEFEELIYELLANCFEDINIDDTDTDEEDFYTEQEEPEKEIEEIFIDSNNLFSILAKDDIKAIYRLLVMRYHPDRGNGNEEKMKQINRLFEQFKRLHE